jgi:hypothetical protein
MMALEGKGEGMTAKMSSMLGYNLLLFGASDLVLYVT